MDDDAEVLDLLATLIEAEGHRADTVSDGQIALENVTAREYAHPLRHHHASARRRGVHDEALQRQWPHLLGRLVFISGYADALDERLRTFITQNGVPIISKPFKRSQISEAIKGKEL